MPAAASRGSRQQANVRASDDLPFDSAGGMSFSYYFPLDGEYVIRVKAGAGDGPKLEVRKPVKAGLRTVGVTFLRESAKPEIESLGGRGAPAAGAAAAGRGIPRCPRKWTSGWMVSGSSGSKCRTAPARCRGSAA